jgi:GT2 family glycosyltransferase
MPPASPRVTVVVTQRESFRHTARSIESLYATAGVPFDLLYVDAGSPPRVGQMIDDAARRHGFRVLRDDRFLTPNEARNRALALVESEFVVFVDNDVVFRNAWLQRLLACADETDADLVGPLTCIGDPPFRKVHYAGGILRIEETAAGRSLREVYRFYGRSFNAVAHELVREPTELLELHCILARRSVFERIGVFDEGLLTATEHVDLCLLVARSGGKIMFEPDAMINELLPAPFPLDRQSLPFFRQRWSSTKNRATIEHFRSKWGLQSGDWALESALDFCNDRGDVIFRYLGLDILHLGLRRLRREVRRWVPRGRHGRVEQQR